MRTFQEKLENILSGKTVLKESEEAYGTHSPTAVKPEAGIDVNKNVHGTTKPEVTGYIPTGAPGTLKTTPGVSPTEGPTGHIPTNADLPRPQNDGLDKTNGPGKDSLPPTPKVYGFNEEEEEEDEKKKKLPPFMKKKKEKEKEVKEEEEKEKEKKKVEEEKEEEKSTAEANKRAGYTDKAKGSGEKADRLKEEMDNEEGDKTKEKVGVKEEEEESKKEKEKEKEVKEEEEDEKADKKAVKEATTALFAGDTISEVMKEKTALIFESTLSARIKEYRKVLNARATKKLNERVEEIREQLAESVNGHLDLVVEDWVKKNDVPLEKSIKSEIVEEFIGELKTLFVEHYFEIPDNKVDVVSEMAIEISSLKQKLNEQLENNVSLQKVVKSNERNTIFEKVAKGLVSTQVEKLKNLSESVEYSTPEKFEAALTTLKDSVVSVTTDKKPKNLFEQTEPIPTETKTTTAEMGLYKDALKRMSER